MTDRTPSSSPGQTAGESKYALFVSIPLIGHLNPLIPQALELARRGWRVAIACTRELRAHVERQARGVGFVDLGPLGPLAERLQRSEVEGALDVQYTRGTARMTANFVELWPIMYDALSAAVAARRPDVMIVNIMSFAGMDVADREGIPFVINNPYLLAWDEDGAPLEGDSGPLRLVTPGDVHGGRYMTLMYVVIDTGTRTLRWASAGHPPAIVYRPGRDELVELGSRDIPLGVDATGAREPPRTSQRATDA